jgi:GNAT superfamily N-acetyltransferase
MVVIRDYDEAHDAQAVGRLIADTFTQYNLGFVTDDELPLFLGPFWNAGSSDLVHMAAIAEVIRAEVVFVAANETDIVGVLRGRVERLQSLFVRGDFHGLGIGRRLVDRFERWSVEHGARRIKVAATLYAVPFYARIGYKKTTGVRLGWCFDGSGLPYQPMKKILD